MGQAANYREELLEQYGGVRGALLTLSGYLSGHEQMAESFFRRRLIDLRGCRRVLDAGCGLGRFTRRILHHGPSELTVVAVDLSQRMLQRLRRRLGEHPVRYAAADVTRLPFQEAVFDAIVCGWVLEHLPEPLLGLRELRRVLRPGGHLYVLVTEDTLPGRVSGWLWNCYPQQRRRFLSLCAEAGLQLHRELWWTGLHRLLGWGGICLDLIAPGRLQPSTATDDAMACGLPG